MFLFFKKTCGLEEGQVFFLRYFELIHFIHLVPTEACNLWKPEDFSGLWKNSEDVLQFSASKLVSFDSVSVTIAA